MTGKKGLICLCLVILLVLTGLLSPAFAQQASMSDLHRSLTRAEATALMVETLKPHLLTDEHTPYIGDIFADVAPYHWFYPAVAWAYNHGWVHGYAGQFRPHDPITREEFVALVVRAANPPRSDQALRFTDREQISPWAQDYIRRSVAAAWVTGFPDNSFRPRSLIVKVDSLTFTQRVAGRSVPFSDNIQTIRWDPNGGIGETAWQRLSGHVLGSALPAPPSRSGYTFMGWYSDQSRGTQITAATVVPNWSVTYWARWQADSVTLRWNANGGTVSPTSARISPGSPLGTLPVPTRAGYTFEGWYTARTGGDRIGANTPAPGRDITYWARWKECPNITVTWNANGGTVNNASVSRVSSAPGIGLSALPIPARDGYSFVGWYTTSAAAGGSRIVEGSVIPDYDITFWARWQVNPINITWNTNGGTLRSPRTSYTPGTYLGLLPLPSRTGFDFAGWFTEETGGVQITENTPVPRQNVTFWARWQVAPTVLTLEPNGGEVSPTRVSITETAGTLPSPTWSGRTFRGWSTSSGETGRGMVVDEGTVILASTTLWARWHDPKVRHTPYWNEARLPNYTVGLREFHFSEPWQSALEKGIEHWNSRSTSITISVVHPDTYRSIPIYAEARTGTWYGQLQTIYVLGETHFSGIIINTSAITSSPTLVDFSSFVSSVMAHELGHVLGLADIYYPATDSIMYASRNRNTLYVPTKFDVQGVNWLY